MTPAELRGAMRERKKELRKALPAMRKAARARVDQVPAVQRARARRRRVRRAIGLAIIAILLLLMRCECGPGVPPPEVKAVAVKPEPKPPPRITVKAGPRKGLEGQGKKQNRGNLGGVNTEATPWHGQRQSAFVALPPLSTVMFRQG